MGNCIRHEKSSWAEDDHGESSLSTQRDGDDGEINIMEKEKLVGGKLDANAREVKIIISKKELKQLMQRVNMQGLTLEQVLASMVVKGGGDLYESEQHRSWKPVLQSIPEVN